MTEIGYQSIIADDCIMGKDVRIGSFSIIYPGTILGDNVIIGDHTIIGQQPAKSKYSTLELQDKRRTTEIGAHSRVGSQCIIYAGAVIGEESFIADRAAIREDFRLGNRSIIGRGVLIEESVQIGNNVKIMTQTHITGFSKIGDYVFIGPQVVTVNDNSLDRRKTECVGPTIETAARIGANVTLLPAVVIGRDALVGAGAVVTKDVPEYAFVLGIPARQVGMVPKEDRSTL